jgi:hypothetical protein
MTIAPIDFEAVVQCMTCEARSAADAREEIIRGFLAIRDGRDPPSDFALRDPKRCHTIAAAADRVRSGHETRSHADAITAARDDRQRMPPGIPLDEHGAPDLQLLVRPLGHAATEARTKSTFTWDFSVGKRLQNQLLTTRQY